MKRKYSHRFVEISYGKAAWFILDMERWELIAQCAYYSDIKSMCAALNSTARGPR